MALTHLAPTRLAPAGRALPGLATAALDLFCGPHGLDRYVETAHPAWSLRHPRATVTAVRRIGPDETALLLRPNLVARRDLAPTILRSGAAEVTVEVEGVRCTRRFPLAPVRGDRPGQLFDMTVVDRSDDLVARHLIEHATAGLVLGLAPTTPADVDPGAADHAIGTPASDTSPGDIVLRVSGRRVEGDGRSILEQLESADLSPRHGCRRGICRTCLVQRTGGRVRDLRDDTYSDAEPGPVRICVNAPAGDIELEL